MKRWNWPTTILYIKHKKANLKQGCSKLVGKKRKASSEGWSGGLNCPIGTGEKKCTGMPLSERAELLALGTTPRAVRQRAAGSPGPEALAQTRIAPGQPSWVQFNEVIPRREITGHPKSRRPGSPRNLPFSSPGLHSPDPSRCPGCGPPPSPGDRAPRSAAQGNARRVDTARSEALKSD